MLVAVAVRIDIFGQMSHSTTNPKTPGKAYPNVCIGTGEADAWPIYYHATFGAKLKIRYKLKTSDEGSIKSVLRDIYNVKLSMELAYTTIFDHLISVQ